MTPRGDVSLIFKNSEGSETNISFSPFKKEDFTSFKSCIEDFYGGGYPYKEYLDAEFLEEKCRLGQMIVLCGKKESGEVISTSAIRFDSGFKESGLLLLRVVRSAYQKRGIASAQEEELFRLIKSRNGLCSLYADVMTHNDASQKSLIRRGFIICGIRLMLYDANIMAPGLDLPEKSRLSQAVMCRRENFSSAEIFCPHEHSGIVQKIYRSLDAKCLVNTDFSPPHKKKTSSSLTEETGHKSLIWKIDAAGEDFPDILTSVLKAAGEDKIILCYLNIKSPAAVYAYEKMQREGFFFTGLKPLQSDCEYMLLSFIGERNIDTNNICLHESGEELFTYIKTHRLL